MNGNWQIRFDDADNIHDLIEVTRDYLATWDRHEIAALPAAYRPGKMFDANDIQAYAFQLKQHHCAAHGEAAPMMEKMSWFFSQAAVRCTEILGSRGAPGTDADAGRPSA